jgi:hypothetical protein
MKSPDTRARQIRAPNLPVHRRKRHADPHDYRSLYTLHDEVAKPVGALAVHPVQLKKWSSHNAPIPSACACQLPDSRGTGLRPIAVRELEAIAGESGSIELSPHPHGF